MKSSRNGASLSTLSLAETNKKYENRQYFAELFKVNKRITVIQCIARERPRVVQCQEVDNGIDR
jgi:hypothetical protein